MHWMTWVSRPAYINTFFGSGNPLNLVKASIERWNQTHICRSKRAFGIRSFFRELLLLYVQYPYSLLIWSLYFTIGTIFFVLAYLRLAETIHSFWSAWTVGGIDSYSNAKSLPKILFNCCWFHQRTRSESRFCSLENLSFWSYPKERKILICWPIFITQRGNQGLFVLTAHAKKIEQIYRLLKQQSISMLDAIAGGTTEEGTYAKPRRFFFLIVFTKWWYPVMLLVLESAQKQCALMIHAQIPGNLESYYQAEGRYRTR